MNKEDGFFVQITSTDKDIDTGWYTGKTGEIFHIHRVGSDGENKNEKNCKKSTHRQDNN